ncbi:MAG: DDE-type integrase/transposase/recombinase [Chloroflexi bacterium]|nr:DDE-type integrase/transposase/recombinase [Chloroflexota bacterium]
MSKDAGNPFKWRHSQAEIIFLLNETRSTRAAKRFFRKMLSNSHISLPRVINVDKNRAYIGAIDELREEKQLPPEFERRPTKYLYNIVEQDHRCVKRQFKAAMGYGTYPTASWRTIRDI